MGLGGIKTNWQRQTKHFGHDNGTKYSVLILDNRGVGLSEKPLARYSTTTMALDVHEVLGHVGWLSEEEEKKRTIHLVGISLGGMIAQELALMLPHRLASLTLLSTTARMESGNSRWSVIAERANMAIPKSMERAIEDTARQVFNDAWLAMEDDAELPSPKTTPRCGPAVGTPDGEYLRFESNFQRWQAVEVTKRRNPAVWAMKGFLMQLVAAGWHEKSALQLKEMGDKVGRERIAILHGDQDRMIDVKMGRKLMQLVQPGRAIVMPGMGHAPIVSDSKWFNKMLEERIDECEAMTN